jgi:hypothetical protein
MLDANKRKLLADSISRAEQRAADTQREIDYIMQSRPNHLVPSGVYDDHLSSLQQILNHQKAMVVSLCEYLEKHSA